MKTNVGKTTNKDPNYFKIRTSQEMKAIKKRNRCIMLFYI